MTRAERIALRVRTGFALGLMNIARVLAYRAALRAGVHPAQRQRAELPGGAYFRGSGADRAGLEEPAAVFPDCVRWFGWVDYPLGDTPPDWHTHVLSGRPYPNPMRPWWLLPDFDGEIGDIKCVWEPSRLAWAPGFAQRSRMGDDQALLRLNAWLADWCQCNPAYLGPNWKCGQEASIRVMHLLMAACVLDEDSDLSRELSGLIAAHLKRIAPTMSYAVAQDNNHGTSEAAALFMGGTACRATNGDRAGKWASLGRRRLEERVARLVAPDGSFSQYSVNYHRVMLDTLVMVEVWRRRRGLPMFSDRFYERARAATDWLRGLVSSEHGDAPNVGANDGALLLPVAGGDYRDYRPSVALAMALFAGQNAYPTHEESQCAMRWLGVAPPSTPASALRSYQSDHGGYAVITHGEWFLLMRYPRYRFRPRHCDALHVDIWRSGHNIARDGGSYSYNASAEWREYFTGTASHNTVQFDHRDQMPAIGRFLRGAWLRSDDVRPLEIGADKTTFAAGYIDHAGARHYRHVSLSGPGVTVTDHVSDFVECAVLRWRLEPGPWRIDGTAVVGTDEVIEVSSDVPVTRFDLGRGRESRYYQKMTDVMVLEIEVRTAATLTTTFSTGRV